MLNLAILISGTGSLARALIKACEDPLFPAKVLVVGSDREAEGLDFAKQRDIPTFVLKPANFSTRQEWGEALYEKLCAGGVTNPHEPWLIVSAGFMRILPASFISLVSPRIINTHPALLPAFPGAHAVRDALAAGVQVTGTSVHVVDEGVDTGPILAQCEVEILKSDTEKSLHERIKNIERPLLIETVEKIAVGEISLENYKR